MTASQEYMVKEFAPDDTRKWDQFVEKQPDGTFFHLSAWKGIIEDSLGHGTVYLYCEQHGAIKAILPLAHVKSVLFGNALISLPFLVYGGIVSSDPTAEAMLLEAACRKSRELNVDHLELRYKNASGRDWPTKNSYASFSKAIDPDPEKNLSAIPRKQRAVIRKGIANGLDAHIDSGVDDLYAALLECKRNLGTPFFAKNYLSSIQDTFGDRAEILTIKKDGNIVCSVMSFKFRNEILPYYGGGGDIARLLKGNDFMYWSVMERACQSGIEFFDFGRSMIGSGAYRFKKHWGFEPVPLSYEYFLVNSKELPSLDPSNPKYRLLIEAWKRLPLPVANILGPPLAKRLG